jgi:hypothetical protein
MKRVVSVRLFALTALFLLPGCSGTGTQEVVMPPAPAAQVYEYWKGDFPNFFYVVNIYGEKSVKVTGKPWLVIKRDPVSLLVLDCEFGLSEVTQTNLPTDSKFAAPPEPTLAASTIDFHDKLQLDATKPVVLGVGWGTKATLVNSFQGFSFTQGSSPGGVGANEKWTFSYIGLNMSGGVKNIDLTYFLGNDSDTNAFALTKR